MALPYYAHTLPGFASIAWREISSRTAAQDPVYRREGNRNDLVLFEYDGNPHSLLQLRSTEDVFFLITRLGSVALDRAGLSQLQSAIASARYLDTALQIHRDLHRVRTERRTTFRVIVRRMGSHRYRRTDAQRAIEKAVLQRYNYAWQAVSEDGDLELWLNLLGSEAIIGLRLSTPAMRHRDYKLEHLPASLRPSAAFSLALLSAPAAADVFLDPFCGAGTILIERAMAGRYRLLLGGDIEPTAIGALKRNIGPRYKPIGLGRWDAGHLPLPRASVDKIVTNPPFGQKVGTREQNLSLYEQFFTEARRVLRPGGRMVLLTSEADLVAGDLARHPGLTAVANYQVSILGRAAHIYVLDRQALPSALSAEG